MNEDVVIGYINYMLDELKIKKVTVNTRITHIKAFFRFCMKRGYIQEFEIKKMRIQETVKDLYTDKEIEILLKKPNTDICGFSEYRTWVMCNLIYSLGLRRETIRNLKNKDVDLVNFQITLRHLKNKNISVFPIGEYLTSILKEYLKIRGGEPDDFLLCTQTETQLTRGAIRTAFVKYARNRGISKTSIHLLRHNFAVKYLLNGGDIGKLRELLTHSTLNMSLHYAKNYCTDLRRDFDLTNPLERMMADNNKGSNRKIVLKR